MPDGVWPDGSRPGPVVVGVVGRQQSPLVAAIAEANRRRTTLRVVHAIWLPAARGSDAKGARLRAAGEIVLDTARQLVEQMAAVPPVEYVLSEDPPVTTLMHEGKVASCVVLGTDDVPWFERLVGGEVTSWLARHAPCPVLAVPDDARGRGSSVSGDIVLAVDVNTVSRNAVELAHEQAELRGCRLRVLYAAEPPLGRADVDRAHAIVDGLLAEARAEHPEVRVVTHIIGDDADDACVQASRRAGLLVVGRPRGPSLEGLLSRPVAMRVLRSAQCPVLVAPGVDV